MVSLTEGKKMNARINSKWAAIKTGTGRITGYIEVFYCKGLDSYVTIPGVSRWKDTADSEPRAIN